MMCSLHLSPIWLHTLIDLCTEITHYVCACVCARLLYTYLPPSDGFNDSVSHVSLLVRSQLALAKMTQVMDSRLLYFVDIFYEKVVNILLP